MAKGTFAAAINCMDGRTQGPVADWMKARYGADFVDMITEAGPVGALAHREGGPLHEGIRRRLEISVKGHGSQAVAIVAHHDCAGNPKPEEEQRRQLAAAAETVRSWGLGIEIVTLWVGGDREVSLVG